MCRPAILASLLVPHRGKIHPLLDSARHQRPMLENEGSQVVVGEPGTMSIWLAGILVVDLEQVNRAAEIGIVILVNLRLSPFDLQSNSPSVFDRSKKALHPFR